MRSNRRHFLKGMGAAAVGGAVSPLLTPRTVGAQDAKKPKFLIVVAGAGGASLVDSFLAIRESEAGAGASTLNCFRDAEVESWTDTPFRAVNLSRSEVGAIPIPYRTNQSAFVRKHMNDLMVVTHTGTSVNHTVAQKRAITGNEAWNGRTLQEAVAAEYGATMTLPNVNMAAGGYLEPGIDRTLPGFAVGEPVARPDFWPLSLDGARGIKDLPSRTRLELARALRDEKLDAESTFFKTFEQSPRLQRWIEQRRLAKGLEMQDLITKLNAYPDVPGSIPLSEYGLAESPDGETVRQAFPKFTQDPLEAQAMLAYLLIKNRVSCTVTISPSFNVLLTTSPPALTNPPLAFDFSHQSHRDAQAVMWQRILGIADRLVDLLKATEFEAGESLWDRSMIFFASDFGRTKRRPSNSQSFGSSHDLNNGFAVLSPFVNGNNVLGGVDPTTALTYGFDPQTGAPEVGRNMQEREIYAGLLHALEVDTSGSGLPDMRAMRKNA
ncbi:MAG: twin-arginine translocation signal domain-containing protein [Deltaproteobacteria bacterium]